MEEVISRAKRGDPDALAQVVAQYKNLLRSTANKFYLVGGDKDDLLQEGMLGLFYAVNDFDESKGSFSAFAKLCVYRQIVSAVKADSAFKNKPLSDYVDLYSAEDVSDDSSPLSDLIRKEYAEKVSYVIEHDLTKTERTVLKLFAEGYSYEDISAKTGKSYKSVDGALQRARKKLFALKGDTL